MSTGECLLIMLHKAGRQELVANSSSSSTLSEQVSRTQERKVSMTLSGTSHLQMRALRMSPYNKPSKRRDSWTIQQTRQWTSSAQSRESTMLSTFRKAFSTFKGGPHSSAMSRTIRITAQHECIGCDSCRGGSVVSCQLVTMVVRYKCSLAILRSCTKHVFSGSTRSDVHRRASCRTHLLRDMCFVQLTTTIVNAK